MRYDERDQKSENVEDRRGQGGGGFPFPGGGGGGMGLKLPLPLMIIAGIIMFALGMNPLDMLRGGPGGGGGGASFPQLPRAPSVDPGRGNADIRGLPGSKVPGEKGEDQMGDFIRFVLKDTEIVWDRVFNSVGQQYRKPQLVLFTGATRTACGTGQAAMGPFYCPADEKIYIDLAFYDELRRRFRAPGDFAQAYVIAHEVGHHIQKILGIAERVQSAKQSMSERQANQLQVRMELQADCFAGFWARMNHQLHNRLEPGDIEEGLTAAAAIGDDMIQRQSTGRVVPESFTHGSSAQRQKWFRQGMQAQNLQQCDTFNVAEP
jgi:uncharacterized protein